MFTDFLRLGECPDLRRGVRTDGKDADERSTRFRFLPSCLEI